jgi:hypothetical protein
MPVTVLRAVQNVVDFAVTTGTFFAVGYALYSSTGNPFSGAKVRPTCVHLQG